MTKVEENCEYWYITFVERDVCVIELYKYAIAVFDCDCLKRLKDQLKERQFQLNIQFII